MKGLNYAAGHSANRKRQRINRDCQRRLHNVAGNAERVGARFPMKKANRLANAECTEKRVMWDSSLRAGSIAITAELNYGTFLRHDDGTFYRGVKTQ